MEQILIPYDILNETVTSNIMLYKNMKAMLHSPNDISDFFDIVAGVLLGVTFAGQRDGTKFPLIGVRISSSQKFHLLSEDS